MSRQVWIALAGIALLLASSNLTHAAVSAIGQPAPQFTATDAKGATHDLAALTKAGKIVVLEWFNPECPYVVKHYEKGTTMNDLAAKYADKDVVWLAISSSHHHAAADIAKFADKWKIAHPVLIDQNGTIGRLYGATTTPNMFIINKEGVLVYSGAIDNDPTPKAPKSGGDTINYVDKALTELLANQSIATSQTKPYGCSVKYAKPQAAAPAPSDAPMLACGCEGGSTEKPKAKEKEKPTSDSVTFSTTVACSGEGTTEKPKDKEKEKPASDSVTFSTTLACSGEGTSEKPKDKEKEKPVSQTFAPTMTLACACEGGSTEKPKAKEKEKPASDSVTFSTTLACSGEGTSEKPKDKEKEKPVSESFAPTMTLACSGSDTTEKPKDKEKEKPAA